jgi:hypothetical protein
MRDGAEFQKCYRCGELKGAEEFAWRRKNKGQRDSHCKPCRSAYGKEHYAANRQRYIDQAAARKQVQSEERSRYLIEFFRTHPCIDCGEADPVVLEFDHLEAKEFNVSYGVRHLTWESVLAEIAKCDVVCANCHRRRTASRGGFVRALLTAASATRAGGRT